MKEKTQQELRKKRNEFLIGLIEQFKESQEERSLFNCYDYVKISACSTIEDFVNTLNDKEQRLIDTRPELWLLPLESLETFSVFLNNHQIKIQ